MFSVADRDRLRDRILALAHSDGRIVAGAVVGSLALSDGDPWSDLDLTFGVADGTPITQVLEDWTSVLVAELSAVRLFDLPAGSTIYRVFLLPGCLQCDLSFTPAADFGAIGPQFKLLFGHAVHKPHVAPPLARDLFGYAVHHAVRARFCIERGRHWQAEYWISGVRDYAMSLACRARGLSAYFARGVDELPEDVRATFAGALVRSLDRDELLRALGAAVDGLLRETRDVHEMASSIAPELRHFISVPDV